MLFPVMLAISCLISWYRFVDLSRDDVRTSDFLATLYSERIQNSIQDVILQSEILANYVVLNNGDIPIEDVPYILELVYDEDIHIGITYAPNGIVEYTHPIESNQDFFGYNILEDELSKKDALEAVKTEKTTLSGPYTLTSGETGLLARNPVFLDIDGNHTFWGFIVIIIDPAGQFLEDIGILNIEELGYEFSIKSNYNGMDVELVQSTNFDSLKIETEQNFNIEQSQWHIALYNKESKPEIIGNVIFFFIISIVISVLLCLLIRNLEKEKANIYEQSLKDSLTKTYNRKGLMYQAKHNQDWKNNGFELFFIDLNKFKPVNDTYGHEIGDKLLIAFAARLQGHLKKGSFIARVGGDEFVVVIPKVNDDSICEQIKMRMIEISENPFYIDNYDLRISSSIGFARFPENGSFEDVLAKADKAMFEYKATYKKGR